MRQRMRKPSPVGLLWHFNGAERGKVRRHELRVKQVEAAFREPRREMHKGDF
jgi:hypothetical protein